FSLRTPSETEAAWFDEAFGYRQKIQIANSSGEEQTDFQVQAEIDTATLISASKLQSERDDLRFTAQNGDVLPYCLEPNTCNTANTLVWVKVPKIPTSGATIHFYYGNPQAETKSQSDQVFIREMDSAVAAWPLDDTEATQSYARVTNPAVEEGRNIVING